MIILVEKMQKSIKFMVILAIALIVLQILATRFYAG